MPDLRAGGELSERRNFLQNPVGGRVTVAPHLGIDHRNQPDRQPSQAQPDVERHRQPAGESFRRPQCFQEGRAQATGENPQQHEPRQLRQAREIEIGDFIPLPHAEKTARDDGGDDRSHDQRRE